MTKGGPIVATPIATGKLKSRVWMLHKTNKVYKFNISSNCQYNHIERDVNTKLDDKYINFTLTINSIVGIECVIM